MYQGNSNFETNSKSNIGQNSSGIIIYPNPANTVININIDDYSEPMMYKVYNQQGQYLFEGSLSTNSRINVSELSNGLYYIEAFNNNGIALREKFIVKH